MPATIIKRQYPCPKCKDMIEFSRADCTVCHEEKLPGYVFNPLKDVTHYLNKHYDMWYLKCPSCGAYVCIWSTEEDD